MLKRTTPGATAASGVRRHDTNGISLHVDRSRETDRRSVLPWISGYVHHRGGGR